MDRLLRRPGQHPSLRGRAEECALLDDFAGAVRHGESRSLVLRGEAGIGKTVLLEYLIASASDMTVLRAAGVESDMELAYAGLHQLCAPLLDRLGRLPGPQQQALEIVFGLSTGAAPDRFLVGLGLLSLLSEVADEGPVLCVVDDAQWLDRASALTLAFVARRLLAEPVGILFAAREPGEELRHFSGLEVHGLRNGDARALLGSAVRFTLDARVRDRVIAEMRGNPLALIELPRGLTATQLAGGFGLLGPQALTGRIEESFVARLKELPDDARVLLLVAAADPVGDPLLLWRAAERLGIGPVAAEGPEANGLLATAEAGALDELHRARVDLLRGQVAFATSWGSDAVSLRLGGSSRWTSTWLARPIWRRGVRRCSRAAWQTAPTSRTCREPPARPLRGRIHRVRRICCWTVLHV